jgi:hypothetical protein
VCVCVCVCGKQKKHKVISLPRGAVAKGPFVECSWQLLSATLGTNFPSSGVPSFAERSCQGLSAKKVFLKNKKPSLPMVFARGTRHRMFSKKMVNYLCRRPAAGSRHVFLIKYKKHPLCRRPGREAVGKEDFKKPSSQTPVNVYFFWPTAHCRLSATALPRA